MVTRSLLVVCMIQVPFSRLSYTWSNCNSKSKLDRFFLSHSWVEYGIPDTFHFPRMVLDHFIVGISFGRSKHVFSKKFRFELAWCRDHNLKDLVKGWQLEHTMPPPSPARRFVSKLRWIKHRLKQWAKDHFNTTSIVREVWVSKLDLFETMNDTGQINPSQLEEWNKVREDYK